MLQIFIGAALSCTLFVFFFAHELKIIVNIVVLGSFAALVLGILAALVPDFSTLMWKLPWKLLKLLLGYCCGLIVRFCKRATIALWLACTEAFTALLKELSNLGVLAIEAIDAAQVSIAQYIETTGWEIGKLLRSFVRWFKSFFELGRDDELAIDPPPDVWRKRLVFIVSLHGGRSYFDISSKIGHSDPPRASINWDGRGVEDLPMPTSFIRHFAVCLISVDLWGNQTMSQQQKFESAVYWELSDLELGSEDYHGVSWDATAILSIDGIQYIGCTTYDDETIAQAFYHPLREAWIKYDAIWWNCFDFALRLACMLLADDDSKRRLWPMLLKICNSRVYYFSKPTLFSFVANFVVGLLFAAATVASAASGPLIIVGSTIIYVASGAAVIRTSIISITPVVVGWWRRLCVQSKYMREWEERSRDLEQRFPQLIGLIDPVEG